MPDINVGYHTAETHRCGRFLKYLDDKFLIQVQKKLTRKGTFQDLLLVNREGIVGEVVTGCPCVPSDYHYSKSFMIGGKLSPKPQSQYGEMVVTTSSQLPASTKLVKD